MSGQETVFGGLRVLDLSTRLAGAFCARLFGDWGAEVLLAEPPAGHPLRAEPPFLDGIPGPDRSLLHFYANANKETLPLRPDDTEGLEELLRWADVLVTTERHQHPDWFRAVNPRLVHICVTPYGLEGPLAGAPANDLSAYALSGWASINGDPDAPPLTGSANQAGYVAGVCAFVAAAAAVYHRDTHGDGGQLVDVSELEALTLIAGPPLLQAEYAGHVIPRRRPDLTRGPVPCKDGYFSLTISRAQFWRDAMNVLGLHDLAEDARYASGRYRQEHRDDYSGRVEERLREWKRWELFEALAAVRCVAGVVQDARDVVGNPHLTARGFFVDAALPDGRTVKAPGAPFKMSESPWALRALPIDDCRLTNPETRRPQSATGNRQPAIASGPLSGVRAIVLTQAWSGTFGTELLGLLGAEIIQIEARRRLDSWRGGYDAAVPAGIRDGGRRQRGWNCNGLYNSVNLNKRAVTLNLSDPRGLALFKRLVPHADIVAENFTPRVMGNLGLDYASLKQIKPDIILASLSAYGATGPYAHIPGIGGTIEPMSGMSSLLGYEGGRPQNSGAMYPDPVSGYYFAAAMILALRHRARTGRGQAIDLGMMEACATFVGDALFENAANGNVRPPLGNHHLRIAPHNIYRCRGNREQQTGDSIDAGAAPQSVPASRDNPQSDDRWLALSADTEAAWRALARHMGCPELLDDPRFATMAHRKANEAALDAIVAAWAQEQDAEAAARTLRALGVTAAPVLDTRAVLHQEQLRARGFFVEVAHPEVGRHVQTGVPWHFSRTPAAVTRHAPMLGEHSREVLAEFLSVSDAEYEELVAAGVTGDMPPEGVTVET